MPCSAVSRPRASAAFALAVGIAAFVCVCVCVLIVILSPVGLVLGIIGLILCGRPGGWGSPGRVWRSPVWC
nr:putative membrane protein [Rhodococcus sp. JVH1]